MRALRRTLRRLVRDEQGAAAVEFAIIVPVLLLIVVAIIDLGRLLAVASSLASAVRDGARQGATVTDFADGTQVAAVRTRVVSEFTTFGGTALQSSNVGVTLDGASNVSVTVSGYVYQPLTPFASLVGLGTITLTRQAVFRWERAS
jgi:Flp pilus assembly protein TadG